MSRLIFSLALVISASSCILHHSTDDAKYSADSSAINTDSAAYYFPLKPGNSFADSSNSTLALDTFINTWYSNQLYHLAEPILSKYDAQREVYRFTWLRSFNHPIAIRIENLKDQIFITVKMCDGNGGFHPGKLILSKTFPISRSQWEEIQSKFDKLDFWNLAPTKRDQDGTDGADWILESKRKEAYHFATRWSPGHGEFRLTCDYIVKLAGFSKEELPQEDIY